MRIRREKAPSKVSMVVWLLRTEKQTQLVLL